MNAEHPGRDLDLLGLVAVLLRQLRLVILVPAVIVLLVAAVSLLRPRRYTVSVVFTPSGQAAGGSQLAGLAAQFGIGGGGPGASESPDFYADLVRSDAILQAVVVRDYEVHPAGEDPRRADLIAAFEIDTTTPAVMREAAGDELRGRLRVSVAPKTGTVTLGVWTTDPALSVQIVQRIMDEVDTFNRQVRRSQARAERQFLQGRMDSAQAELRAAQDRMQAFLQRNRDFAGSPQLQFQRERLQQELVMQQGLYTSLAQAYEQARMEEVRATPVITVVQPPVQPARPDPRRLAVRGVLFLILGSFVGIALALAVDGVQRRQREAPEELQEIRTLWRAALAQLTGFFRRSTSSTGK